MIRKCWNTIKYGTAKAKVIVLSAFGCCLLSVGLLVCAVVFQQMLLGFAGIVCLLLVVALAQTLVIQGGDTSNLKQDMAEPKAFGDGRKKRKQPTVLDEPKSLEQTQADNGKKTAKKSAAKGETDTEKATPQEKVRTKPEPISSETLAAYDKKRVKKTLHKYKVRREHRQILVDRSEKLGILQTPAYIWVEKNQFHMLLLEETPRHISIPLYQITQISYRKKQRVNEKNDYAAFQTDSIVTELFRPYLPDYIHMREEPAAFLYKNLYGIGNDIYVTNRSAAAVFELLGVEFQVEDRVTQSDKVNIYFKDIYKANILLRDNVIDANGYAERISRILDSLVHSSLRYDEVKETLHLMIRNKLITQEFASHYLNIWETLYR